MSDKIYAVPAEWSQRAWIDAAGYRQMYERSVKDPEGFWGEMGRRLDWMKPYTRVKNTSFDPGNVSIKWYEDGTLNLSVNCVDRHLATRADQVAIIWEGDDPTQDEQITYRQLHERVCKLANVLKANGVQRGDCVTIYLPMIPEAAYTMLACARIGAVHSIVFGGFSPEALAGRIEDADSRFIVTADESMRGGKAVALKKNADEALRKVGKGSEKMLVVRRTGNPVAWTAGRDIWLHEELVKVSADCPPAEMNAEDPLFILYTSGSTGKPKGVVHTTGGYLVYASMTHQYVFDYHDGDIYWCTADVGWVTGHSYIVYGPLANGATTLMFEGIPTYPTGSRFWHVIDKWKVNTFYTAPTAIRALMAMGDDLVKRTSRASLRLLGSVGEPINPEAWESVPPRRGSRAARRYVDTWWQTETGGIMIANFAATDIRPGSMGRPLPGIEAAIVHRTGDDTVEVIDTPGVEGELALKPGWPSMFRTTFRDEVRY
ncbi:MAG: acetate--CoA ligase, partial [Rhodospirillales bacterium]|nr:acetate--CoA ligase [Rhodospirillales bacterium]